MLLFILSPVLHILTERQRDYGLNLNLYRSFGINYTLFNDHLFTLSVLSGLWFYICEDICL